MVVVVVVVVVLVLVLAFEPFAALESVPLLGFWLARGWVGAGYLRAQHANTMEFTMFSCCTDFSEEAALFRRCWICLF